MMITITPREVDDGDGLALRDRWRRGYSLARADQAGSGKGH